MENENEKNLAQVACEVEMARLNALCFEEKKAHNEKINEIEEELIKLKRDLNDLYRKKDVLTFELRKERVAVAEIKAKYNEMKNAYFAKLAENE